MPEWLSRLVDPLGPIPMRELLEHCVYYPAAGLDGDPVKYLGRYFQSFVYVDDGVGQQQFRNELWNFDGYHLFSHCDVPLDELVPEGWERPENSNPTFAVWAVFDRNPEVCPEHGPQRFSLLYIGGRGTAMYHSLFYSRKVAPAVVALIKPRRGRRFRDPNGIFARLVRMNPDGMPDHLLYSGWGNGEPHRQPFWLEYQTTGLILSERLRLFARRTEERLTNGNSNEPETPLDEFDDLVEETDDHELGLDDQLDGYLDFYLDDL